VKTPANPIYGMRYINYARRSSDEKSKKQVQSIEDQLADTRRFAHDAGLNVLDEMTESKSAKEPGRPVFNAMLERIRKGEADAILCWKHDRLARNPIDAAALRWMMRQGYLKEIRTPYQVYGPDDNAVIAAVDSAMAEQYIIDLKKGVERGMRSKCEKGGFPFMAPQGYSNDRATRTVEVDLERFPVLRRAWELLLTEKYTLVEVHRILVEDWGYRGKTSRASASGKITVSTLNNMFRNPFYKGLFTFKGQVYTHQYQRMVTPDEWERAQQILNRRTYKSRTKHAHAFTGLITCASCGYAATAERSKGHTYYHCLNKLGICTKKGIREEEIEGFIDEVLESIILPPEFEELCDRILDDLQREEQKAEEEIKIQQQAALSEIKKQKDALLSLCLAGHLTTDEFAEKKQELTEQETRLAAPLAAEGDTNPIDRAIREVASFTTTARSRFATCPVEEKRLIARQLATAYYLNNGKELKIELHPIFVPVRSQLKSVFHKIEPLKTGSGNWKEGVDEKVISKWYTALAGYRRFLEQHTFSPGANLAPQPARVPARKPPGTSAKYPQP